MRYEPHRCDLCGRIGPVKTYYDGDHLCTDSIACIDILDGRYEGIPWKVNQEGPDPDC